MPRLSLERFDTARSYVMSRARPLERALWCFHFDGGPIDDVWDGLAEYRNPDGGFGHALEPDLQAPESSVLATQTALSILAENGAPNDHELVVGALDYLIDVFDPDTKVWRFIPESVAEHPHAPWWDQERLAETFNGFLVNPRVNVVAYLLRFGAPKL